MNERLTFVVAALVAELTSSILFYVVFPTSPLTAAFPNLLTYAGQHGSLALAVWVVILAAVWFTLGPQLVRIRQNASSKISILAKFGVVGLAIDGAVSLYQLSAAPQVAQAGFTSGAVLSGLAVRGLVYALGYAAVVMAAYFIGLTQKSTMTPPPRFGRE